VSGREVGADTQRRLCHPCAEPRSPSHGNVKEELAGTIFVTAAKTLHSLAPALSCRRNCRVISDMLLNYFIRTTEALKRLRADHYGLASFEYIIVATCIVIVVIAVYSGAGGNSISGALSSGFAKVTAAMNTL